jgi:hypothetical protein
MYSVLVGVIVQATEVRSEMVNKCQWLLRFLMKIPCIISAQAPTAERGGSRQKSDGLLGRCAVQMLR